MSLRLWLRLFTCTHLIERAIRARLRVVFATTLPRFDLMAQLARHPEGLRMGELSERLLVTGANVTAVTDQLMAEGLVAKAPHARDRRAYAVRLTPRGRRTFDAMARAHEAWIVEFMSALDAGASARLYDALGKLKDGLAPLVRAPRPPRSSAASEAAQGARRAARA